MFGNVTKNHGRSKVQAYSYLVEEYYKLQAMKKEKEKLIKNDEEVILIQEDREMYESRHKLERLMQEVDNLEVLERQYGIRIPKSELLKID